MATRTVCPEVVVGQGPMSIAAHKAADAKEKVAHYKLLEEAARKELCTMAEEIRDKRVSKNEYLGLVRVVDVDLPPTRVEFRFDDQVVDVAELPKLDEYFDNYRADLFERAKVVSDIPDPDKLFAAMKKDGLNPYDYMELKVREGMDGIVARYRDRGVKITEAFLPRKDFFTKLTECAVDLTVEAKAWVKTYLDRALKSVVVISKEKTI